VYASEADPLYKALDAYEDAAGAVGVQTISTQGAYRQLTDAISGHGDLREAQVSFALEATILAVLHDEWKAAGAALVAEVADGEAWQQWFVTPRKRCNHCGDAETWIDRFTGGTCSDCRSNAMEGHPDNIAHAEFIEDQAKAEDDLAARRAFYGS
jgi:hypothetical protein